MYYTNMFYMYERYIKAKLDLEVSNQVKKHWFCVFNVLCLLRIGILIAYQIGHFL